MSCPSSIRCWDSNPQPLVHESPHITTRSGLIKCSYSIYLSFNWHCDLRVESFTVASLCYFQSLVNNPSEGLMNFLINHYYIAFMIDTQRAAVSFVLK